MQTFENIVVFPGTIEQLLSQAHAYAEQYQYNLANEKFEETLQYTQGDEMTLSVYAYSLYEARDFEKAKEYAEISYDYVTYDLAYQEIMKNHKYLKRQ